MQQQDSSNLFKTGMDFTLDIKPSHYMEEHFVVWCLEQDDAENLGLFC